MVPGRFRVVPGGSGRFRVGSAFYIHPEPYYGSWSDAIFLRSVNPIQFYMHKLSTTYAEWNFGFGNLACDETRRVQVFFVFLPFSLLISILSSLLVDSI